MHRAALDKPLVIANHVLVAFHAAFISSLLALPAAELLSKGALLRTMFASLEVPVSLALWYAAGHAGIALHEMGHYLTAGRISALTPAAQKDFDARAARPFPERVAWLVRMFATIPWGAFPGVVRSGGLNFHPDAPFNLAVAAAGPRFSGRVALACWPVAVGLLAWGMAADLLPVIHGGRLFLGLACVATMDRFLADPGSLARFAARESAAAERAAKVASAAAESWFQRAPAVHRTMATTRLQTVTDAAGRTLSAPWQFRNCAMGGRHTEKEFPASTISMQEAMYIPLGVKSYEEAQEMTIRLQTRLKEHVETMAGGKYEGVGLEGGLALVLEKDAGDAVPEQRLYRIMVEVIRECGFVPGRDVAIAIDPAATELANAYREKSGEPGARGMYLFWRHKDQVVMSRDDLLRFYEKIVLEDDIPLVSIEDGFAEDDFEGWKLLKDRLGDRVFVVGDDLVTTNDRVIEEASDLGLLNAVLVKSNQIGSVTETSLAMLTALGLGNELVISHRSKSPNEDMEAHNALATGALGMKCGGGTNTERLVKYGAVMERIKDALAGGDAGEVGARRPDADLERRARELFERLEITKVVGNEAPTNAGIPTVGVTVTLGIPGSATHREVLTVRGATSLGTSAGTGEAIHLVDVIIEDHILMLRHPDLFERQPDGSHRFARRLDDAAIAGLRDPELSLAWRRSHRYDGKGCLNAVDHVDRVLRRAFLGKRLADLGQPEDIDRSLLGLELSLARERSRLGPAASREEAIAVMQRKGQLGMNAILSMSLALARLVGVAEGRELWQVIRDQMARAMARAIAKNGGLAVVEAVSPRDLAAIRAEAGRGGALQAVLVERMLFDELVAGLRTVAKDVKSRGGKLHEVLRAQLGPYG